MKFAHNMIRVLDLDQALNFWVGIMGLEESKRSDYENGRFTLVFLKEKSSDFTLELTHNWDNKEEYENGRNFGHIAFTVEDIYKTCDYLESKGVEILRPPRDGYMAFIKSPNKISIELLQEGERLSPKEPWASMENKGSW